jgi:hypothetical protein
VQPRSCKSARRAHRLALCRRVVPSVARCLGRESEKGRPGGPTTTANAHNRGRLSETPGPCGRWDNFEPRTEVDWARWHAGARVGWDAGDAQAFAGCEEMAPWQRRATPTKKDVARRGRVRLPSYRVIIDRVTSRVGCGPERACSRGLLDNGSSFTLRRQKRALACHLVARLLMTGELRTGKTKPGPTDWLTGALLVQPSVGDRLHPVQLQPCAGRTLSPGACSQRHHCVRTRRTSSGEEAYSGLLLASQR